MTDDTDTIQIRDYLLAGMDPQPAKDPPRRRPPDGISLAIVSTVLFTLAAAALVFFANDPKMTSAQVSLITAMVLIVAAASLLVCRFVRVSIGRAEDRVIAEVEDAVKKGRCQFYDLSSDVAATAGEMEGLKALIGDFVKRYPPVEGHENEATEEDLRRARTEGYVEGVRERLSGASRVVEMPRQSEA